MNLAIESASELSHGPVPIVGKTSYGSLSPLLKADRTGVWVVGSLLWDSHRNMYLSINTSMEMSNPHGTLTAQHRRIVRNRYQNNGEGEFALSWNDKGVNLVGWVHIGPSSWFRSGVAVAHSRERS
jgi:hypothetical protein